MRKIYYLFIFVFSFSVLSAQEKLSKEEKARREKNIQAGNPFAQFGYNAKIATLSKGKYLEFHDLDSIVTIGTVRWHVSKNQIVGRIVQDSLNPDDQPIGDQVGRWISPDPLSEEFPSWSPYNFTFNNPIRFLDPDGRAPMDIIVMSYGAWDGKNGDHRWGHQAILVGDDKKGWTFYSLDGDAAYTSGDGSENNNYTIKSFKNLDEFANSEYNTFKRDYDDGDGTKYSEKSDSGDILQRFKEGYRIETTDEQDKKMNIAAAAATKEGWNMLTNNCTVVPEVALNAAGLKNGEFTEERSKREPYNMIKSGNILPNTKQKEIERVNKGKDVDAKLKRN